MILKRRLIFLLASYTLLYLVNLDIKKQDNKNIIPAVDATPMHNILLKFNSINPTNIKQNEIAAIIFIIVNLKLDTFECDFSKLVLGM
jgi:hypothetical protein